LAGPLNELFKQAAPWHAGPVVNKLNLAGLLAALRLAPPAPSEGAFTRRHAIAMMWRVLQ